MTAIYHITHISNLPGIIARGLWSDRRMAATGGHLVIGYDHIKQRRLRTAVPCHPGTTVGDFVPFYFCPRSPMLCAIHYRSSALTYKGGQREIVTLVSSVDTAVADGRPIAYTATNAGAAYTVFHDDPDRLDEILDWKAIGKRYWKDPDDPGVKERKQAEFLVRDEFPWTGFTEIATLDRAVAADVAALLAETDHRPTVAVRPDWYY